MYLEYTGEETVKYYEGINHQQYRLILDTFWEYLDTNGDWLQVNEEKLNTELFVALREL